MGFFAPKFSDINVENQDGSIKCHVKLSGIGWRFQEAQIWLDRRIMLDMQPYIPFKTGDLQRAITVKNEVYAGTGKICLYTLPYGKKVYYGITDKGQVMHYTNPLTTPRYFENVKALYKSNWTQGVKDIIFGRKVE